MTDSPNPTEPKNNNTSPSGSSSDSAPRPTTATSSSESHPITTAVTEMPSVASTEVSKPTLSVETSAVKADEPAQPSSSEPTAPKADEPVQPASVEPTAPKAEEPAQPASVEPTAPKAEEPAQPPTEMPTTAGTSPIRPPRLETEPKPPLPFSKPTTDGKVKTDYLNLPKNDGELGQRMPTPGTARLTSAWKLRWKIGEENILMAAEDKIVIGRAMEGDTSIGFDLTPHGAYHFGVSRMHAVLTLNDGYLYLEDLNSTNGTRINGFQVTPKQKYRLRDGDEIEFARLRTTVKFDMPKK